MAISGQDLNTAELAYAAIDEVQKVQYICYIRDIPSAEGRSAELALLRRQPKEAEAILISAGALELAIKHKTHVDTVLYFRDKFLKKMSRRETIKQFLQYSQSVTFDAEKIKAKIAMEEDSERTKSSTTKQRSPTGQDKHRVLLQRCQQLMSTHPELATSDFRRKRVKADGLEPGIPPLAEPMIVDETELLADFWKEHGIKNDSERIFLEETLVGVLRNRKALEVVLRLFYEKTGGRYLRSEYNLFAILIYLGVFRLKELTFTEYRKFIKVCDPTKMSRLVAFMFDSSHLVGGCLAEEWGKFFDHDYVKTTFVAPLLDYAEEAKALTEELLARSSNEFEPFLLTRPNARKLPEPTVIVSTLTKARPIPKDFYSGSGEKEALEKKKAENRERQKQTVNLLVQAEQQKAAERLFSVAKKGPSEKGKQIRQKIVAETEKKECLSVSRRPLKQIPPSFKEPVAVKLTTATILREDALVRKARSEEQKAMAAAEISLRDASEFNSWQEELKQKADYEKKIEAEKRKIEIQLLHEEALEAKQDRIRQNQEIVKEAKSESEALKEIAEAAKKNQDEENRKKIEGVHDIQEGVQKAKIKVVSENQRKAADMLLENQALREKAQREADEELARKAELIQQIRLLERSVAPVGSYVKSVDPTETAGLGLLGEMSTLELQERWVMAKNRHAEWEESKRREIIETKKIRESQMQEKLEGIDKERWERARARTKMSAPISAAPTSASVKADPTVLQMREKLAQKREANRMARKGVGAVPPVGGILKAAVAAAAADPPTENKKGADVGIDERAKRRMILEEKRFRLLEEVKKKMAEAETVKLISADGFEFIIDRRCAMASGTIKNMLSSPGQFTESVQNEVTFRDIKAVVLERVCKFLYYKVKYTNTTEEIPPFDIDPEQALETLMAADFLDC
ncbi:hypothetical protein HK101_011885 [Irineochytrium annulatum]|nr:hypothetical protein HK101_011885 [Irineochytrium annulatum]